MALPISSAGGRCIQFLLCTWTKLCVKELSNNSVIARDFLDSMSSVIKSVFKATVGSLIEKGRDLLAEKLREGDVEDERFRSLIVREIEDIKSKLDSIALRDLLASVSFFKEGLVLFFELFKETTAGADTEDGEVGIDKDNSGLGPKTTMDVLDGGKTGLNFPEELEKIQRSRGDNSTARWFSKAQSRFQDSRRKATEAFNDKALSTIDRIFAMQYRVMATILEVADNPREALPPCQLCLEELHAMPAVKKNFKTAFKPGRRFFPSPSLAKNERERGEIIFTVVYINKVIYDVKQMVGKTAELLSWPCVDTGEEKVDPLRDVRVAEILRKQDLVHGFLPSSFGLASRKRERRIILPRSIASTKQGHIIVAESGDNDVKVFDRSGKYLFPLEFPGPVDKHGSCNVLDVAADQDAYVYVLTSLRNYGSEVCVFNKAGEYQRQFGLKNGFRCHKMTVLDSKVLVLVEEEEESLLKSPAKANQTWIHVYDTKGVLVESFPDRCQRPCDVTATTLGRVMVLDHLASCVNALSTSDKDRHQFKVRAYPEAIAFHEESKQVIIASVNSKKHLNLSIYSQDGKFVRSVQLDVKQEANSIKGMAVNKEGRIAVIYGKTVLVV